MSSQIDIELDDYEREIEENFDKHKSLSPEELVREAALLKTAAKNSLKKDKRITIRVYTSDLENLKLIAMQEGLKYQSLITSILHKFATGHLKEFK